MIRGQIPSDFGLWIPNQSFTFIYSLLYFALLAPQAPMALSLTLINLDF